MLCQWLVTKHRVLIMIVIMYSRYMYVHIIYVLFYFCYEHFVLFVDHLVDVIAAGAKSLCY